MMALRDDEGAAEMGFDRTDDLREVWQMECREGQRRDYKNSVSCAIRKGETSRRGCRSTR